MAERKRGLIAGNLLAPCSASAHRTFRSKEQHPRTLEKASVVFRRDVSGLRSAFLSVRKVHIGFWCGMQTATIFKQKNNCTVISRLERHGSRSQRGCDYRNGQEWHHTGHAGIAVAVANLVCCQVTHPSADSWICSCLT